MISILININDVKKTFDIQEAIKAKCEDLNITVLPQDADDEEIKDMVLKSETSELFVKLDDGYVVKKVERDDGPVLWWSVGSEVTLVCPSVEEAFAYPKAFAEMTKYVNTHDRYTDINSWHNLVTRIKELAANVSYVSLH